MMKNIQVPKKIYNANTGPKGVVADAQAYERAWNQENFHHIGNNRNFSTTTMGTGNGYISSSNSNSIYGKNHENDIDIDDDEDKFMQQWRESRMRELQNQSINHIPTSITTGGKKMLGVQDVDAEGYLNIIENSPFDTIVVVCIYDPDVSSIISFSFSPNFPNH